MKIFAMFGLTLALMAGLAAPPVAAEEVTLSGTVMCAKCTLKKADAKQCQDVLVVEGEAGAKAEYYIAKNAVAEKFGHVCNGERPATVTGEVTEKDGKKWMAATKMQKIEQ